MCCRVGTQLLSIPAPGSMSLVIPAIMLLAWIWVILIFLELWGQSFGELRHLKYLELYRNDIGGKIPKELGNMKNLVSMDIYGNRFEGEIPKSFAMLKSLRFLRLNNNKLSGSIPRELTTLKDLKVL
ncbi:hypothetical protein OIU76_020138 [Salix suchowensis]|nr:hypothetical protein OIU76_020138 [Salix suchowensis]